MTTFFLFSTNSSMQCVCISKSFLFLVILFARMLYPVSNVSRCIYCANAYENVCAELREVTENNTTKHDSRRFLTGCLLRILFCRMVTAQPAKKLAEKLYPAAAQPAVIIQNKNASVLRWYEIKLVRISLSTNGFENSHFCMEFRAIKSKIVPFFCTLNWNVDKYF